MREKAPRSFKPRRALVRVMLARARIVRKGDHWRGVNRNWINQNELARATQLSFIDNMIQYARIVEIHDGVAELAALDLALAFIYEIVPVVDNTITGLFFGVIANSHLFLCIRKKIESNLEFAKNYGVSLLKLTLQPSRNKVAKVALSYLGSAPQPIILVKPHREYDLEMIKLLLELGIPPREVFSDFILGLLDNPVQDDKVLQVIELLLQYGAASFNEALPLLKRLSTARILSDEQVTWLLEQAKQNSTDLENTDYTIEPEAASPPRSWSMSGLWSIFTSIQGRLGKDEDQQS